MLVCSCAPAVAPSPDPAEPPVAVPTTSVPPCLTAEPASPAAEAALADLVSEHRPEAAAILVIDAATGCVLGLADHGGALDRPIPPGSTLKPLVMAAALSEGLDPTTIAPGGETTWEGRVLRDHTPGGGMNLTEVIAFSSNVGMVPAYALLGEEGLADLGARLGWAGSPPDHDTSIGVEELALAYAALATDGARPGHSEPVFEADAADQVRTMLAAAVGAGGTGRRAALPTVDVAGKTGTARVAAPEGAPDTWATFVGFAPALDPEVVVVVTVDRPGGASYAGVVAAPAFADVVDALMP